MPVWTPGMVEDPNVVRQINRIGRKRRVGRRLRRAALKTGAVETRFDEIPGGHADSQNWRQEREQGYGDDWAQTGGPLNTRASVNRFYDEALALDRGQRAGELAADVQRPREDLRGLYGQQRVGQLLKMGRAGGGAGATVFRPGTPDRLEVGRQTTFDQEGYEQAQRRAFLGERLGVDRNSILFKSGLLGGTPSPEDFTSSKLTSKIVRGKDSELVDAGDGRGGLPSGQVGAAVSAARKRLGVQEVGTSNTGAKVNKWERQYGMVGQPWCGIFTGIVLKNAGVEGWNDPSMPSVAGIEARARSGAGPFRGWASPNRAEAGDLLITKKGQHVAFIERVDKRGRIHVIGGNQTGGVTRVVHDPGSVYGVAKVRYGRER